MANLSKIKRDRMLSFLEKIKEKIKTDDEALIALGEIENALKSKRYGIVWEEHNEAVDEYMIDNIPVFNEVIKKTIVSDENKPYNFLIEGDNLHSLYLLSKTHKGKIDIIYIDPPYNTGNKDFIYDDRIVDKTDGYFHSKWLSFMEKRLSIAKELLNNEGFIFISIDDNEVFQLKLLCDEIFGEDNFIISLPRQTKKSGKTTGSFSKNHDYILVYSNGSLANFKMKTHIDSGYKYRDEFFEERGLYKLNQTLDYDSLSYSKSLDYPIIIGNETFYPGSSEELWKKRQSGEHNRADWAWRWSKPLFEFAYKNGFIKIKRKKDGTARIYTKTYAKVKIDRKRTGIYEIVEENRTKASSSLEFIENIYSNDNAKKDLKKVGLENSFDYSKPVTLLKEIISLHKKNDITILDFFAGSGTTGHAVVELNNEDGGNRKYILCTNNENNICEEVTYERLRRVQPKLPHNLKYYKTDFVSKKIDFLSDELLKHVCEMIQLETGFKIDGENYVVLLKDEDADILESNWDKNKLPRRIYYSREILLSTRQSELFNEVEMHIIPDYYFDFEMKEVGESW